MGSRFRFTLLVAACGAVVAGVVGALLADNAGHTSSSLNHLTGLATIIALPAGLGAAVILVLQALPRRAAAAQSDMALVEAQLGQALERESHTRHSVVLDPTGREHPVNLRFDKVTSPFRDCGGHATGDRVSIMGYFDSVPTGRLVILGGPGSGQMILAIELQAQLLELRGQDQTEPFPVLVSATSFDPAKSWTDWLAAYLARRYLIPEQAAEQLLADGRILPIIDGVDELEWAGAAALIHELNVFVRDRELMSDASRAGLIITCQEAAYQDLAEPVDGAVHVEVRPLTPEDVRTHLRESGIETPIPDPLASVLSLDPRGNSGNGSCLYDGFPQVVEGMGVLPRAL